MQSFGFILLGAFIGAMSGLFGVGGGILLVPALVIFYKFSQHAAQGTTLAMLLPPIGLMATYKYWQNGHVRAVPAVLLAAGFLLGSWFGANHAVALPDATLKKGFGILLMLVGAFLFYRSR